jgi:ATP-dependent exoDNAse (exonuclease V) beta subunit
MTRARDLVVTSASPGKNSEGWLKQLEPLVDRGDIPATPYSTLRAATASGEHAKIKLPTPGKLAAALASLTPPPEAPRLQRIPATKLANELDDGKEKKRSVKSEENAAALGSLGHAVLEQLALNDWEGSVAEWLESLRDEFGIGKAEAAVLRKRIEQTRELMRELTGGMQETRPEFPFLLLDDNRLIDGTIDLLCRTSSGGAIYDYKFTEATDSAAADAYRGQMAIYHQAAGRVFPDLEKIAINLVVVSETGPRLVPVLI